MRLKLFPLLNKFTFWSFLSHEHDIHVYFLAPISCSEMLWVFMISAHLYLFLIFMCLAQIVYTYEIVVWDFNACSSCVMIKSRYLAHTLHQTLLCGENIQNPLFWVLWNSSVLNRAVQQATEHLSFVDYPDGARAVSYSFNSSSIAFLSSSFYSYLAFFHYFRFSCLWMVYH